MNHRFGLGGWPVLGVLLVGFAAGVPARGDGPKEAGRPLKVLVHVNFADVSRQGHGLKNVENILKAAGEAGSAVEVEVVCHGDGIVLVEKSKTGHAGPVEALLKKGVRFAACQNTMRQRSIRPEDLLPSVTTVPSGAFEVARRQQDGYSYFKP